MIARDWLAPEVWRLDKTTWRLIVAAFAATLVFVTTPWMTLGAMALLVGCLWVAALKSKATVELLPLPSWLSVASVFVAFLLVSLLWTADVKSTAISAVVTFYCFASAHLISRLAGTVPSPWLEHTTRAMLLAYFAAVLFLLSEELSGHAIKRVLFWPFHAIRWQNGAVVVNNAPGLVNIPPARVKWNIPPVNLMLWPMLLILQAQLRQRRGVFWLQLATVSCVYYLIVLAEHRTSQAAILAAIAVFAFAHWNAAAIRRLLIATWLASFVFIIPVALSSYRAEMHLGDRVGSSMAARIILWHVTASKVAEHPLVGVGAAATRKIDNEAASRTPPVSLPGHYYPMRTGPHAHNAFLQSWYELGAIGTALFAAIGVFILALTARVTSATQPYVLATATTILVTISASFGLFETWFMGALSMCAIVALLALEYSRRAYRDDRKSTNTTS